MGKRKAVYWILLALIMVTVTGCGYTLEEKREMKRYEKQEAQLVKQYQYKGETGYDNIISKVTDDGKYIHGIVYTRDETEIKISVFIDK